MKSSKEIFDNIEQARALYSSIFKTFIACKDPDSQRVYKSALDAQMKAMFGLVVNYRKAIEQEEEELEDAKWADKE